jgi:hypothetical protein
MANINSYWLMWAAYLTAGVAFVAVFWEMTRFRRARWLAYFLRALIIAVIFTPWYASSEGDVMAPALIVILLDAITVSSAEAARATVPLVLSASSTLIIAGVLFLINRKRMSNKSLKTKR